MKEIIRRLEDELGELKRREDQVQSDISRLSGAETDSSLVPVKLSSFMLEDLSAFDWLINSLMIRQGVGILAGDGGTGKSFLAQQLGLCVAGGKRFLGFNVPRKARVLYLAAEGARLPFRQRLSTAARTLMVDMNEAEFYVQSASLSQFHFDSDEFRRLIDSTRPDLVVCDTLGFFLGCDENDSALWKKHAMEPINDIRREYGTSILIIHHKNKTGESGRKGGRGTSAMFDDVDLWLDLNLPKALRNNEELLLDAAKNRERILVISKNKYCENQSFAFKLWADFRNAIFEQRSYEPEDTEEDREVKVDSQIGLVPLTGDEPEY